MKPHSDRERTGAFGTVSNSIPVMRNPLGQSRKIKSERSQSPG
jgi:hypothetical protein